MLEINFIEEMKTFIEKQEEIIKRSLKLASLIPLSAKTDLIRLIPLIRTIGKSAFWTFVTLEKDNIANFLQPPLYLLVKGKTRSKACILGLNFLRDLSNGGELQRSGSVQANSGLK